MPASAAPGSDSQDEPDIGNGGGFNRSEAVSDDDAAAVEAAGRLAAEFKIPNGKHRGLALAELPDKEGGLGWLKWALTHISEPQEYVTALWSFARTFAPDVYTEALAAQEASVQA